VTPIHRSHVGAVSGRRGGGVPLASGAGGHPLDERDDFEHPRLRATVTIHGAGTPDGALRIIGRYWFDTFFGALRVSGEIGRRHIEVSVQGN
jgi:hypothetical protein